MVTPLRARDELDVPGLEKLVEHIIAGGVSGVFVLGTTGEGPSLGYRLRRELIKRVCKQTNGRVPILVGISDTAFAESVNLARHAADVGANAVVVAPPYYLPEAQPELREYLDHLVPELPLPLFLYNMPALTKVSYELETVRHAMDNPRIIGLKDSSGDMGYFKSAAGLLPAAGAVAQPSSLRARSRGVTPSEPAAGTAALRRHRPDWSLLIGPEEKLFDALQLGGHGGVSGGANLFPKLYVQLCEAFRSGDLARARQLQKQIQRVSRSLYRIGKHSSSIIKGIKCALKCLGVCDDFMAEPFHRFRAEERALVRTRLKELEAEVSKLKL